MARSTPRADLALIEMRDRIVHIALRAELHNADYFAALSDNVCLDWTCGSVVTGEVFQILPRSHVGNIFNYDPVPASPRAVSPRAAAARRAASVLIGRSGARPATTAASPAGRLNADPTSAEARTIHLLDAIISISRIVEDQESESRFHCNIIGPVLPKQIFELRAAAIAGQIADINTSRHVE